ncbi:MAG: cbb3-type cytochrome c oxidase subunit 3 [Thiothrix sp.]|jgi:cytochrome c oxidase cbb3-type subunit IV|uniref:cbb3-type cytochrome oxidase subunit 3 n=1 Tax=Thiothrix sp. TaxID=1032 RepID=UPI00262F8DB4|nr:cbb3-type cytochrome c oxidase subunit 3 [Thiothrix sp.]MDD5392627.1 cbb3-type cytochrome c oxidase subunit 3 [Thiothrix sp.]
MDYNDFRGITTLTLLIAFVLMVVWAYSRKRKRRFDVAANSIFDQEDERVHEASVKEVDK